jgi:putative membrane protein
MEKLSKFLKYSIYIAMFVLAVIFLSRNQGHWVLDSVLIIVGIFALIIVNKRIKLSRMSFFLILIFILLGAIGTYYGTPNVPFGFTLQKLLGTLRNPYDRLVHFAFGLLFYYPILEFFKKTSKIENKTWLYLIPLIMIIAIGGAYEVTEWIKATNIDPKQAKIFMGTQGDPWDAQKDILMGFLGGILAMFITLFIKMSKLIAQKTN